MRLVEMKKNAEIMEENTGKCENSVEIMRVFSKSKNKFIEKKMSMRKKHIWLKNSKKIGCK